MLCAALIRGISSIAGNGHAAAANSEDSCTAVSGSPKPHEYLAGRSSKQIAHDLSSVGAQAPHRAIIVRFP